MNLYYNKVNQTWYYSQLSKPVTFGFKRSAIGPPPSDQKGLSNNLSFSVRIQQDKAGPLIGFLVYKNKEGKITVYQPFVTALAKKVIKAGGIPVLVPIEHIQDETIEGALFDKEKNSWVSGHFPLPDFIFNRISSRKVEKSDIFTAGISFIKEQKIPFFNPHFLDKYETYLLLKQNHQLQAMLPETLLIRRKNEFKAFCQKWKTIYIKPRKSFKGNGIFILKLQNNGVIVTKNFHEKNIYHHWDHFWEKKKDELTGLKMIAQQAISPLKKNGRRFDFRVLTHLKNQNEYKITGIGVRVAASHNLTTHIPRGGKLQSYALYKNNDIDVLLRSAVSEIGRELTNHYGLFGEFSVDAGLSKDHTLKIFEINAKPMKFDEAEIEQKRLDTLCKIFLRITGFI